MSEQHLSVQSHGDEAAGCGPVVTPTMWAPARSAKGLRSEDLNRHIAYDLGAAPVAERLAELEIGLHAESVPGAKPLRPQCGIRGSGPRADASRG